MSTRHPPFPRRLFAAALTVTLTASAASGQVAETAPRAAVTLLAPDSARALLTTTLVDVRRAQELFLGRQRIYARSLGQLEGSVTVPDEVTISFTDVSPSGYTATARLRSAARYQCSMTIGDGMSSAPGRSDRRTPTCTMLP